MKSKKLFVVSLFLIYLLGIILFDVYMRKAGRADPIIYSKNVSSKNEGYIVKVSQYFYRPKLPFEKTEVRLSVEREENKEIILDFSTTIDTDGKKINSENYLIDGNDKFIKVSLFDNEGKICDSFRFYYSDFE